MLLNKHFKNNRIVAHVTISTVTLGVQNVHLSPAQEFTAHANFVTFPATRFSSWWDF